MRAWAAGLWDFVWSGSSGFWSIAKLGAGAERVESSAASASSSLGVYLGLWFVACP
jgi:hypothetical protein